jgi:hypothetical protein
VYHTDGHETRGLGVNQDKIVLAFALLATVKIPPNPFSKGRQKVPLS